MKYKTKPVVIEAYKYQAELGNNRLVNWLALHGANIKGWIFHDGEITIPTLEGDMKVSDGDFIIRGLKGEYYPCKPDIFEMKYEETEPFAQECQITVPTYERPTCRGSFIFGSACGHCERCNDEWAKMTPEQRQKYWEKDRVRGKIIKPCAFCRHYPCNQSTVGCTERVDEAKG